MGMRSWARAGLAVVVLAGCSDRARDVPGAAGSVDTADPVDSDPIVLAWPRSCWSQPSQAACAEIEEGESFMAAGVGGRLAVHGGCVMAEWEGRHATMFFPYGTAWDASIPGIRLPDGSTVQIGDEFNLGGGGITDRAGPAIVYNGEPIADADLTALTRRCMAASDYPDKLELSSPNARLFDP